MKIRIVLDDDREWVVDGRPATIMCLADRVAFERRYQTSAAALAPIAQAFTATGELRPDADASVLGELREEWMTFFLWCEARRRDPEIVDFDELIAHVVEVEVDPTAPDPTEGA